MEQSRWCFAQKARTFGPVAFWAAIQGSASLSLGEQRSEASLRSFCAAPQRKSCAKGARMVPPEGAPFVRPFAQVLQSSTCAHSRCAAKLHSSLRRKCYAFSALRSTAHCSEAAVCSATSHRSKDLKSLDLCSLARFCGAPSGGTAKACSGCEAQRFAAQIPQALTGLRFRRQRGGRPAGRGQAPDLPAFPLRGTQTIVQYFSWKLKSWPKAKTSGSFSCRWVAEGNERLFGKRISDSWRAAPQAEPFMKSDNKLGIGTENRPLIKL